MPATRTVPLAFRVDQAKSRRLERLAAATQRSKSWLLEQALDAYLTDQLWQVERIKKGLADLEAGRTASHEEAMATLDRIVRDAGRRSRRKASSPR